MPARKYTEQQFLSGLVCPAYIQYKHNVHEQDLAQLVANNALKVFLSNIDVYLNSLNLENVIARATAKAMSRNFKLEETSYKKSIKSYCYNFIYRFLERYPPSTYYPILLDLEVPVSVSNFEVNFYYDIILKESDSDTFVICNFLHTKDSQIQKNHQYFLCKYALIADRLQLVLNSQSIKYTLYHMPKHKPASTKNSSALDFIYLNSSDYSKYNISPYLEIFKHKLSIQKNPFCIEYTCPKRKECYGS